MLVVGFAATDTAKVNVERANLALRIYRDRVRGLNQCRMWIFSRFAVAFEFF
jgi:hypothetical protein